MEKSLRPLYLAELSIELNIEGLSSPFNATELEVDEDVVVN